MIKEKILGVLGNAFTTACVIADTREVSEHFRFIDIESAAFGNAQLTHADKIQLNVGNWNVRAYTPITIEKSRMRLLTFAHGDTPGAQWAKQAKVGDRSNALGPKGVLRAVDARPVVFFGDETSFATLARMRNEIKDTVGIFEVDSIDESRTALSALGIADAVIVQKKSDDTHHHDIREQVLSATTTRQVLLSGNALSIQRLVRALKEQGKRATVKPYWAPGKVGLD